MDREVFIYIKIRDVNSEPETTTPARDLIADTLAAMGSDQQCHSDALCARLSMISPQYAGWYPRSFAGALAAHGVVTRQIWGPCIESGTMKNRYGVTRQSLEAALRERPRASNLRDHSRAG